MDILSLVSNEYERKARLYPALILLAPLTVTALAIISDNLSGVNTVATVVAVSGGAFLLAQLARDKGKKGEKDLFVEWGGLPSVAILRHRDARIDSITKARYHQKLAKLVQGTEAPSIQMEKDNPTATDEVYTAWSNYLRINSRDTNKYALLFQENINYGFRRNIWGMRLFGILLSVIPSIISAVSLYQQYQASAKLSNETIAAFIFSIIFLGLWIFCFTPQWVRVPADAYAERLAEIADNIGTESQNEKK
jgi:hypothetical protein